MDALMFFLDPTALLGGTIPAVLPALFMAALLVSSVGFIRLVYFISIGYGFSVAGMMAVTFFVFRDGIAWTGISLILVYLVYGIRLGTFLWLREFQSSYAKEKVGIENDYEKRNLAIRVVIWISVALLYAVMVSPVIFVLVDHATINALIVVGILIAVVGLIIESLADWQKSRFKKRNPELFCSTGLFGVVRNPNYFGEIVVWLGGWVAGLPTYGTDPWRWILATTGLVIIVLIMLGSARRLELKQESRYGADPDWQRYSAATPVLIPLIPLKSLKKLRVYLG